MAPPDTAFRDQIQRDPTICNSCFRKTHDLDIHERWSGLWGWVTHVFRTPRPTETSRATPGRPTKNPSRACACGMIGGGTQRPVTYDQSIRHAERISERLTEKGISHDSDALVSEVSRRKREPANQLREDTGIYAPAVALAIHRARRR